MLGGAYGLDLHDCQKRGAFMNWGQVMYDLDTVLHFIDSHWTHKKSKVFAELLQPSSEPCDIACCEALMGVGSLETSVPQVGTSRGFR